MGAAVIGVVAAALAGYGVFLVYTATVMGWGGLGPGPRVRRRVRVERGQDWLRQAGLEGVRPAEFGVTMAVLLVIGALLAFAVFGGLLPAVVAGLFAASLPIASYRGRRARRMSAAREGWPRMLEELRLLTGSLGRSVPQALFEVGRRAPDEMRGGFASAEREWLLSTDFARTLDVLRAALADPTADVVCETLIVAHEVGGSELERRLADLVEDRVADLQGRRDAEVKQAGVRFARRFVLLVPLGMALAGLSIGTGRSAYATPGGQLAVAVGLLGVAGCWVWSGRLMRLPLEPRVFAEPFSWSPAEGSGAGGVAPGAAPVASVAGGPGSPPDAATWGPGSREAAGGRP